MFNIYIYIYIYTGNYIYNYIYILRGKNHTYGQDILRKTSLWDVFSQYIL